ncbi:MAG: hypothetical protein U0Z44_11765 [Kouleothrix sp.]
MDDIAHGHIQAMEQGRPGESYIIAGAYPHADRGDRAGRAYHRYRCVKWLRAAPGALKAVAAPYGPGRARGAGAGQLYGRIPTRERGRHIGSNAKARRELGYRPRPLAEGLAATLLHEMALLGMAAPPAAG